MLSRLQGLFKQGTEEAIHKVYLTLGNHGTGEKYTAQNGTFPLHNSSNLLFSNQLVHIEGRTSNNSSVTAYKHTAEQETWAIPDRIVSGEQKNLYGLKVIASLILRDTANPPVLLAIYRHWQDLSYKDMIPLMNHV